MDWLEEMVFRVVLKNPAIPITLDVWDGRLQVRWVVPDRDSGHPTQVGQAYEPPPYLRTAPDLAKVRWVHDCVRRVFTHEFDECFHLDGQRLQDPHRP